MDLGLHGQVVFVAGSSAGIGLAISEAFAREGARVAVSGRHADALVHARQSLAAVSSRDSVMTVQGDLTEEATIRRALEQVIETWGRIDAVVANIGSGSVRNGWDISAAEWQAVLQTNLIGGMLLAQAALPHLMKRPGSSLTFISSIAGLEAITAPLTYGAAKAALQSAVKTLSRLGGMHGVRVNVVAPGNILFPGSSWARKRTQHPDEVDGYLRTEVPLQRFGRPDEIADAVVFLASARASFITGACLVVDGGQTRSMLSGSYEGLMVHADHPAS